MVLVTYTHSPLVGEHGVHMATKNNKGGRPKNPNSLTPAQRKAKERERKKESGLLRLHTEVEVPTAIVLERAATVLKTTVSQVVAELVAAHRNNENGLDLIVGRDVDTLALDGASNLTEDDLMDDRPRLNYVTRDANPKQVNLDLPADVHAWVTTRKGMSAGAVVETLVNVRCFPVTERFVGHPDCEGTVLTVGDHESRRMLYAHPRVAFVFLTDMYALTPADGHAYRVSANKYERRRNTVLDFVRARFNKHGTNDAYGDAHLNNAVEAMNRRATTVHPSVYEGYYNAARYNAPIYDMGAFAD